MVLLCHCLFLKACNVEILVVENTILCFLMPLPIFGVLEKLSNSSLQVSLSTLCDSFISGKIFFKGLFDEFRPGCRPIRGLIKSRLKNIAYIDVEKLVYLS